MLKVRKLACLVLVVSFAFTMLLAGCGKAAEPTATTGSSTSSSTQAATTAATEPALEPYEINWLILGPSVQKDTALVEAEVDKYLKDKINATLKLTLFDWGTYEQKLTAMISAGDSFDICFTSTWPNSYVTNATNGAYVEMNDLMDKYAPKTKALLGDTFLNASKIKGKNYAIPTNKEKARNFGIIYNKTLAAKYGFDMTTVKTFADLEPMLKTVKEKEAGITPWQNYGYLSEAQEIFTNQTSGQVGVMTSAGQYINQFETPEYKAGADLARKWYLAGYFKKDAATDKSKEADVKAGKFFAYAMNTKPGYVDEVNTNDKQNGFERGQIEVTKPMITNNETMGSMQAISRTSKNPERAMMFLELENTDKYLNNLIAYGIETKHYTKINENTVRTIPDSGYNMGMNWMFGNQFLNYLNETENPKKWEMFEAYNASATPAPDLGFIFDNTNVKTEQAACANAIKEFRPVIGCGAVDPAEYLKKLNDKLKGSGMDKVLTEMNTQFAAWKAASK